MQWDRRIASIGNVECAQKPREGRVAGGTVQAAASQSWCSERRERVAGAQRSTSKHCKRWALGVGQCCRAAEKPRSLPGTRPRRCRTRHTVDQRVRQPAATARWQGLGALRVIYTGHESAGACGLPAKTTRGTEPHATRQRLIDGRVLSAHHSGDDLGPRDKPSPSPAAPHTVVVVCRGGRAHIRCRRRRRMRKEARALAVSRNPSRPTLLAGTHIIRPRHRPIKFNSEPPSPSSTDHTDRDRDRTIPSAASLALFCFRCAPTPSRARGTKRS